MTCNSEGEHGDRLVTYITTDKTDTDVTAFSTPSPCFMAKDDGDMPTTTSGSSSHDQQPQQLGTNDCGSDNPSHLSNEPPKKKPLHHNSTN